ncbi:MAG: DUF4886 domain-containing protein [Prevotella sp.]|jgi:beta-glucosidase
MNLRKLMLVAMLFVAVIVNAKDGVVRILAIGNSFSEDAIEQNLHELAAADGQQAIVANMFIGGCSLERHLNNAKNNAADYRYRKIGVDGVRHQTDHMTLAKAIMDEEWDYISLQQVSGFSGLYDSYTPSLPSLLAYVRKLAPKGCKLIWHQTWAYAQDSNHGDFKRYNNSQMEMYKGIMDASRRVVKDYKLAKVVPSGTAIQNARTSFIGDHMNRDGYHLNLVYGRYTAACTWYEAIFGKSVVGNSYAPKGMKPEVIKVAQEAAHQAVLHPYKVTDLSKF